MNAATFEDFELDSKPLTGSQRTAALLLSMGRPLAGRLLKHFEEAEMREVVKAAAQLGAVSRQTIESLIEDFAQDFTVGADLEGNVEELEQLLNEALPAEQAADIISDVFGSSNSGLWERISNVPDARVADFLRQEHPQAAAFILSRIGAGYAATILANCPRDFRNEVLKRMVSLGSVSDKVLKIVENVLQESLMNTAARSPGKDACAKVAEIINQLEPADADDVMQSISQSKPEAAVTVKRMLFTFEDLLRLSTRARSLLFDSLSTEIVVLALRGTDAAFRDVVLSSMASRARRLVESELSSGASAPQKDVLKARRQIAETVLKMAQRNEIELNESNDSASA